MSGHERYDRAITVFSPDGRLLQVEYAREAVSKGSIVAGLHTSNCVILGGEKGSMSKLQEGTAEKIYQVDDHMMAAFAGLGADASVLVNQVRMKCAQAKYEEGEPITVSKLTQALAAIKQKRTLTSGLRPYGVSTLLAGWNKDDEKPGLYQIDPNGAYLPYVATAIGRNEQLAKDYLERNITGCEHKTEAEGIKLVLQALQESFAMRMTRDNVEVAIIDAQGFRRIDEEGLQGYLDELTREEAGRG